MHLEPYLNGKNVKSYPADVTRSRLTGWLLGLSLYLQTQAH